MKKYALSAVILLASLGLAGCGGHSTSGTAPVSNSSNDANGRQAKLDRGYPVGYYLGDIDGDTYSRLIITLHGKRLECVKAEYEEPALSCNWEVFNAAG